MLPETVVVNQVVMFQLLMSFLIAGAKHLYGNQITPEQISEKQFEELKDYIEKEHKTIYSNGIVKVTSGCPTWLSFTALHYHFQSQPLPNSISYYSHFLPDGIKRIFVAITFFIEI